MEYVILASRSFHLIYLHKSFASLQFIWQIMDACNFIIAVVYINTLAMMYAWRHRPHKIYSDITWKYDSAWSRFLVRLGNLAFGLRRVKHKYLFFLSRSFPWLCNSRSSSPHFHTFLSDIHSELCYILVRWL